MSECGWVQDSDGSWETGCGHIFEITEGTPAENSFKFCCYCGGPLIEHPYDEAEEA